jgi:hypothetical protein
VAVETAIPATGEKRPDPANLCVYYSCQNWQVSQWFKAEGSQRRRQIASERVYQTAIAGALYTTVKTIGQLGRSQILNPTGANLLTNNLK